MYFHTISFSLDDSMVHLAGIFHNMYLKLVETEDEHYRNDNGWKFHIHDVNEIPVLGVTTHGTSLYPGQGRDLRLDMKKVRYTHFFRSTRSYMLVLNFVEYQTQIPILDTALLFKIGT